MDIFKKLFKILAKMQKYFFANIIALCGYVIFAISMFLLVFIFKDPNSLEDDGAGIWFIVVTISYSLLFFGLLILMWIEHLFKIFFIKQQNDMPKNSVSVYSMLFFIGMLLNICYLGFLLLFLLFVFVLSML